MKKTFEKVIEDLKKEEREDDMAANPVEHRVMSGVMPHDRLLLTRLENKEEWRVTSNPSWDYFTSSMNRLLMNECNEYVEAKNCGIACRMIRLADVEEYGISIDDIQLGWVLLRDEAVL